jgi:hypothetical protein
LSSIHYVDPCKKSRESRYSQEAEQRNPAGIACINATVLLPRTYAAKERYSIPSGLSLLQSSCTHSLTSSSVYSCSPKGQRDSNVHTQSSASGSPIRLHHTLHRVDTDVLRTNNDNDSPLSDLAEKVSPDDSNVVDGHQISYRIPFSDDEYFGQPCDHSILVDSNKTKHAFYSSDNHFHANSVSPKRNAYKEMPPGLSRRSSENFHPAESRQHYLTNVCNNHELNPHPYGLPSVPSLPTEVLPYRLTTSNPAIPGHLEPEEPSIMHRQRYVSAGGVLPLSMRSEVEAPFHHFERQMSIQADSVWCGVSHDIKYIKEKKKSFMAKLKAKIGK